ncbi:thioesterase family protein [Intrasporangium sp.]|uniref:thioesterase family protein n=1 Tax=Intrasporangium sp. TaxID=1925024 RepID=UPI00293B519C|nr:thioesterase family protein [Intrasporangium sp.]MDV3219846.1 thioesterase family protein [Intrasporangium sp.]
MSTTNSSSGPPSDGEFTLEEDVPAFYRRIGDDLYAPTVHAQGAWRDDEQHMAPVSGILTHAIDLHEPREGMQLARVSFDILGMIPARPSQVAVRTTRPGRSIELVEATLSVDGRDVVRAHAWRLAAHDSSPVAAVEFEPMPGPESFPAWHGTEVWEGGYIRGVEFRADPERRPGRTRTWIRSPHTLVDGETCSPTADLIRLVDTANGIAVRVSPQEWMFPNVDLTIHLFREPVRAASGWVGFDTKVTMGATGMGLTSTTLHDELGPVGRAEQILTVRPMSRD